MDVQNKDLVGAAKEITDLVSATKEAYKKIEDTNTKLEAKLIILDRKGEVPDVDKSMTELSEACQDYWEKWETVRTTNKMILMEADFTVKNIGTNSQVGSGSAPTEFIRFNPAPDTRPSFLERESQMLEVITWIEQATYYVKTGFKNQPPQTGSLVHLSALINPTWLQSIESKGAKMETLEGIMNLIRIEAEIRNPLHARRIQLLKAALKKTGSHSDHLQKLEREMEICDWESMTKDQFLIHLFAESADMTMSKIAMEILSSKNPTVAELRSKIAETENSLWYGSNRNLNMGKFAGGAPGFGAGGAGGAIGPVGQPPQGRFCKPCNSSSH